MHVGKWHAYNSRFWDICAKVKLCLVFEVLFIVFLNIIKVSIIRINARFLQKICEPIYDM